MNNITELSNIINDWWKEERPRYIVMIDPDKISKAQEEALLSGTTPPQPFTGKLKPYKKVADGIYYTFDGHLSECQVKYIFKLVGHMNFVVSEPRDVGYRCLYFSGELPK